MATQRRFKACINGGEVTLALAPGEKIVHSWHKPHDEGAYEGSVTFEADREGILRTTHEYDNDCDGRHEALYQEFCPWDELKTGTDRRRFVGYVKVVEDGVTYFDRQYEPDPGWPNWQQHESPQYYDQFAEAMNY